MDDEAEIATLIRIKEIEREREREKQKYLYASRYRHWKKRDHCVRERALKKRTRSSVWKKKQNFFKSAAEWRNDEKLFLGVSFTFEIVFFLFSFPSLSLSLSSLLVSFLSFPRRPFTEIEIEMSFFFFLILSFFFFFVLSTERIMRWSPETTWPGESVVQRSPRVATLLHFTGFY